MKIHKFSAVAVASVALLTVVTACGRTPHPQSAPENNATVSSGAGAGVNNTANASSVSDANAPVVNVTSTTVTPPPPVKKVSTPASINTTHSSSAGSTSTSGYGSTVVPAIAYMGDPAPQLYAVPQGDVAITIDDGPSPYSMRILDTLQKYGVKATFFYVGKEALAYPDVVKRAVSMGETIGDHTYNHPVMTSLSWSDQDWEINAAIEDIQKNDPNPIILYRPPYGAINTEDYKMLADHRMSAVLWNFDPRDWADTKPDQVIATIENSSESGSIIDFHSKLVTAEALPKILQILHKKGLHFVTFTPPKGYNGVPMTPGTRGYYAPPEPPAKPKPKSAPKKQAPAPNKSTPTASVSNGSSATNSTASTASMPSNTTTQTSNATNTTPINTANSPS